MEDDGALDWDRIPVDDRAAFVWQLSQEVYGLAHLDAPAQLGTEGRERQADLTAARALPCKVCGHPVAAASNHDIPAAKAAKMFPIMTCHCGKPARVRCFNGLGTFWTECEDGHGVGRPA